MTAVDWNAITAYVRDVALKAIAVGYMNGSRDAGGNGINRDRLQAAQDDYCVDGGIDLATVRREHPLIADDERRMHQPAIRHAIGPFGGVREASAPLIVLDPHHDQCRGEHNIMVSCVPNLSDDRRHVTLSWNGATMLSITGTQEFSDALVIALGMAKRMRAGKSVTID